MGHLRFTPGNTVALIAVIARRLHFDPTKKNRSRLATQPFARSVVGKRLDETDIPSHERSGPVQLCPATALPAACDTADLANHCPLGLVELRGIEMEWIHSHYQRHRCRWQDSFCM